jgi:TonB-dependent receptor
MQSISRSVKKVLTREKTRHISFSSILILTLLTILTIPTIASGSGRLKGVVVDSLSNSPLLGANVIILGTAMGASTDGDGNFDISRIPAGTYTVRCSYIGYITKEYTITIPDNRTLIQDFYLNMDVIQGQEIIVSAQAIGQAAAINRQITSNTIINVVSVDKILEIPDANAAESVGRLPGISILREGGEGNKVTIRGLAPTYNAVTIGGDKIPSTDFDDRSVDMSMISSEILSGIEVTKALTADQEADAIGGTIEFKLAEAPKGGFKYNLRFQNGYNDQRQEFGQYRGSLTLSQRFFDDKFGIMVTGNAERVQRGSDELRVGYEMLREKHADEEFAPLSASSVRFNYVTSVRERKGFTVLLDYQLPEGKILLNNFISRLDKNSQTQERRFSLGGNYQYHNWFDEQSQIDIMTSSLSGEHNFSFFKLDWRLSRSQSYSRLPFYNEMEIREQSAFDFAKLSQFRTPTEIINAAINNISETYLYEEFYDNEKSLERDLAGQFNIEIPFTVTDDIVGRIKTGAKLKEKLKERDRYSSSSRMDEIRNGQRVARVYERHHSLYGTPGFKYLYTSAGYAQVTNYLDKNFDAKNFLNGRYEFGVGVDGNELNRLLNNFMLDSTNQHSVVRDIDDYESTEKITSGYILTEIDVGQFLMFMPGIRYEKTFVDMIGRQGNVPDDYSERPLGSPPEIKDTAGVVNFDNWFPMIHFRIKPTNWFDIRLAYTKTISRPRLDYLLPKLRINASSRTITLGNPRLQPQISTNLDGYISFYGNQIGLLAGGVFYKGIDNLIYDRENRVLLDPVKDGYPIQWKGYYLNKPENSPFKTDVYGMEIEWQTNLKWLPSPFDGIVLNVNYTHVWSDTKYPRSKVIRKILPVFPYVLNTVVDTFRVGKMINQANDIANVSIGYDRGSFSGRISMLFQGKTLGEVGDREELDSYTDDYIRWDLLMKYDFTPSVGIYMNLNNFTNSPDRRYSLISTYQTAEEYYDWTIDVGLNIKLK